MKKHSNLFAGVLAITALFIFSTTSNTMAKMDGVVTYAAEGAYSDIKQDLQDAIVNAGLKIDYHGDIGTMLERTGKDVGSTKPVYKHAEFFQFCSARLSRSAMEADVANMSICPYVVYLFEPAVTPGKVIVGYKRPPGASGEASQKAIGAIDKLLDAIVKEAAGQ